MYLRLDMTKSLTINQKKSQIHHESNKVRALSATLLETEPSRLYRVHEALVDSIDYASVLWI